MLPSLGDTAAEVQPPEPTREPGQRRGQLGQGRSGECSQLKEIANDEEEQGQGQDDVEI